jgi:hydrogenase small subunit
MNITRRQFLQYCTASAAALGLSQMDLFKLEKALAAHGDPNCYGAPHVIWFQGQSCGGCTYSILNRMRIDADLSGDGDWPGIGPMGTYVQDVVDLLVGDAVGHLALGGARTNVGAPNNWAPFPNGYICLDYQTVAMAGAGDPMMDYVMDLRNGTEGYFVGVSGSMPILDHKRVVAGRPPRFCISGNLDTGDGDGVRERSITEIVEWLATGSNCLGVVAFGTCAAYGGIPAGKKNLTMATGVYNMLVNYQKHPELGGKIINVPGCAPHPDWMIFPIAYFILTGQILPLDTTGALNKVWRKRKTDGKYAWARFENPLNRAKAIYGGEDDKGYNHFCQVCPKFDGTGDYQCTDLGAGPGNGDGTNQKEWCTRPVGCNGWMASPDCPTRRWNNFDDHTRNQWCVGHLPMGSNYFCQGCAEPDFPDGRSPFFEGVKNGS